MGPSLQRRHVLRAHLHFRAGRKASWRRPPSRPLNVWLNKIQDTNALLLSTLWRSEIAMGHGAAQRSLGIRDDDDGDGDDDYDDDEGLC